MATIKKYNGSTWENAVVRKYGTASEIIVPPTTIYADGSNITTYSIKGNTVQNGTPTPSNPVSVNGVGERTENLWDEQYSNISGTLIYKPIYVGAGEYTLSTTVGFSDGAAVLFLLAGNVRTGASSTINGVGSGITRTVTAVDGYVTIAYRKYAGYNPEEHDTMLNSGSTAKPYEPYGYKIPILINSTTYTLYIGDNPLRKSLDGTAYDTLDSDGTLTQRVDSDGSVLATPVITHITMPTFATVDGANTITVDTTVQPSEFTATYTGWHDSSVKEYDGTNWQ